ncbi:hypothetical protein H5410_039886 [Solanum commersonii]|uniref:ATP synthase subunit alpha, mitochondrial n=1 Tax=Solanum commersonii TaxID=4109 RepID=A0A9J5XPU5_SOLCO|nr:hypothetical protein H5410_039886 [Solanum commersonii]
MVTIRNDEISNIIRERIEQYNREVKIVNTGTVLQVGDGIARIHGLDEVMAGELVEFEEVLEKQRANYSIPVSEAYLGRVVNARLNLLMVEVKFRLQFQLIESATRYYFASFVYEPLQIGLIAIDSMIPIGRGQRELIIGDACTGKIAVATHTILNQQGQNERGDRIHYCDSQTADSLLHYNTLLLIQSSAEYFMYRERHTLIIYDDLSKQAQAYRQMSLLLRRSPGREAYPGDVFYLHSRLLERAAKLSSSLGEGSMTAFTNS